MNLQVGGACGGLAALGGDPAGVEARVRGRAVAELQGEERVLAGHLDAVRQLVVKRLVVLQPRGRHASARASAGLERGLLAG